MLQIYARRGVKMEVPIQIYNKLGAIFIDGEIWYIIAIFFLYSAFYWTTLHFCILLLLFLLGLDEVYIVRHKKLRFMLRTSFGIF